MKFNFKRFISFILLFCIIFNCLCFQVFPLTITEETIDWVNVESSTKNKKLVEDLFNDILTEIDNFNKAINDEIASSSNPNKTKIMNNFVKIIVLLDWCSNNALVDEISGEAYSIFNVPLNTEEAGWYDEAKLHSVLSNVNVIYNTLKDSGLFNSAWETSVVDGKVSISSVGDLVSFSSNVFNNEIFDIDSILGNEEYRRVIQDIISYYYDYHALAILANDVSGLSENINGASLKSLCDNELKDNTDRVNQILSKRDVNLVAYMESYQDLLKYKLYYDNIVLDNQEINFIEYKGYTRNIPLSNSIDINLSDSFKQVYKQMFAVDNQITNQDENIDINIDYNSDILSLLSNVKINNSNFIYSDEPELTNLGYVLLASGAVYDPFVSKAGDKNFVKVVESFLNTEEQKEDLAYILHRAINYKKPLYITTGGTSDWKDEEDLTKLGNAQYSQAILRDVLDIDKNTVKAYVVIKGLMKNSNVDSSTWEYVNSLNTNNKDTIVLVSDSGDNVNSNITLGVDNLNADDNQVSAPIMITGGYTGSDDNIGYALRVGGLTSLIINNASCNIKNSTVLNNKDAEMLFINGLGDIVLSDNTIVLPAIANPIMYNYSLESIDFSNYFNNNINSIMEPNVSYYYPYTVSFMNNYPSLALNSDTEVKQPSESDIGKYYISTDSTGGIALKITGDSKGILVNDAGNKVSIAPIFLLSFNVTQDLSELYSLMTLVYADTRSHNYGDSWYSTIMNNVGNFTTDLLNLKNWGTLLVMEKATNANGIFFFPLVFDNSDVNDDYIEIAKSIVTSALRFISDNYEGEDGRKSNNRLKIDHYILDMCGEALLGTQYSETLMKNYQMSYDDIVNDTMGRVKKFIVSFCDDTVESLGVIEGVLAIKGPYSNGFFNLIINFINQFYIIIAVFLMVIVAVRFFKGHYNFLYVAFMGCICVCCFELYVNILPTAVVSLYNFIVNDISEQTVWNTVAYKAESYDETYKNSDRKDIITGELKPYTSTIILYKLSNYEMNIIARQLNVDMSEIKSGEVIYLDQTAGIYLQGNEIRQSIDKLFVNNPMRGLYQSQWESLTSIDSTELVTPITGNLVNNPYSIQITNPYISLEIYYTPFCHIERAFISNLNAFSSIFKIERNTFVYGNDKLYKDAFMVSAFLKSGIVTAPGDDEILKRNILKNSITGSYILTEDDIISLCNDYFNLDDDLLKYDWLNIHSIFDSLDDSMKQSIWGYMLQARGYYDYDWNLTDKGSEKIADLIKYINTHTKVWIIDNLSMLSLCSDENAIKLISLYATTCWTHYMSEFGEWLYPNYINAEDLQLKDILYGSMTSVLDRSFSYDGTITNTVAANLGLFGVILVLIILFGSVMFVFIMTYLVPILYLLFGGVLIYKLVNGEKSMGLVKGYFKITGWTCVLYILYNLSMNLIRISSYNWYGYFGCVLCILFCNYMLVWTLISVIQDVGELGNNTLSINIKEGLNKLTKGALTNVYSGSTNLYRGYRWRRNQGMFGDFRRYGRNYNIDDYLYSGNRRFFNRRTRNSFGDDRFNFGRFSRNYDYRNRNRRFLRRFFH